MQDDRIIFNKLKHEDFLKFIKSPITALVFSIILSLCFYFLGQSKKSPCYFYSQPILIAEKASENLKILFKGEEVRNVYYTNLILWNEGDDYIDYNDFIEEKPIRFFSENNIEILAINILKKSRDDLNFKYDFEKKAVNIRLANDEALEENDGVCFHILYTTNDKRESFELKSRIKGNINGFVKKDLNNFKKNNSKFSIYFLWGVIILLLLIRIITLVIFKKEIVFRVKELVFLVILLLFTIFYTVDYIFYTTNLKWLEG